MTRYDIYIFFLCLIAFILLVSVFAYILTALVKLYLRSLHAGLEDEIIKTEYDNSLKENKRNKFLGRTVSLVFEVIFLVLFVFAIIINIQKNMFFESIPTLKMVNSGSMSEKHEKNVYLAINNLNDQIQTFDLIFVYKVPEEKDLKLYDTVLYEVDGTYIIHRIVGIEEPNKDHPDERHFLCQGDANEYPDRFPVYYSQIRAIYKGERIPFIGSFISFLQSPAGWLCIAFVLFSMFGAPVVERKLYQEQIARLKEIGYISNSNDSSSPDSTEKNEQSEVIK